jgi:survival-of-motor-neuron-related-splicing factor 30
MKEAGLGSEEVESFELDAKQEISKVEASLARLRPELAALETQLPQTAQPAAPKFDMEKHPLLRKTVEKQEPEKLVSYSTGDMVEAQWSDRSWYKAKIQSVLGSASAPKYMVRFIEYDDSMTVDASAVRPLPSKRKRDPEPVAAPSPAIPVTSTPHVISGPASVNPNAQVPKKNIAGEEEVKPKSRIANKGQLKKRQTTWQDFQAKTSKKMPKKESMFRTSTEAGSRGMYSRHHGQYVY